MRNYALTHEYAGPQPAIKKTYADAQEAWNAYLHRRRQFFRSERHDGLTAPKFPLALRLITDGEIGAVVSDCPEDADPIAYMDARRDGMDYDAASIASRT